MPNAISSNPDNRPLCSICLEDIQHEALTYRLNCNHEYHRDCLELWLYRQNTCPLDRSIITSINGSNPIPMIERIRTVRQRIEESR